MKLTKNQAQELIHKFGVLADTEDLQSDYGITKAQADSLVASVPFNGGEWICPPDCIAAAKGEMADCAIVLRDVADDARSGGEVGQALACNRLANTMDEFSGKLII